MEEKNPLRWVRLDNAAKIYPAARRREWSNLFRQSVTLREEVDVQVLQSALDVTVKRFPTIAARLRKGAFWYYLHEVKAAPRISPEYCYPLVFMDRKEIGQCAFRVIAYKNRIAVEFFHSLTDGTGALVFLKSLTAEYLEQKYHITVPAEEGVLDRREAPKEEELEDSFPKYAGKVPASRKDTNAWKVKGTPALDNMLHLTCFRLDVEQVLQAAHGYNTTMTVFLSAVMMQALQNLQKEKERSFWRRKGIKLLIPINLRRLFPSQTLRNFAMYTIPEIDPRLGDYTIAEICKVIESKMAAEVTPKHMSSVIATNVADEQNPFLRAVPLPIKNVVMKAIFDTVGEKKSSLTLSNLGLVKVPESMKPYIERFDFILGPQAAAPNNCGMVSYENTVYINFIRNIREADLERHFYYILRDMGIRVTVESNQPGGEQDVLYEVRN